MTGIFKDPVEGPRMLRAMNIDGDAQADLSVHGGRHKAAYAYPSEHYAWWRAELPGIDLPWGMFGENFTTEGMAEESVHAGDRFRIGGAIVVVTQPRMPCFKLGMKFGRNDMVRKFLQSGRTGFYVAVEGEGPVCAGDAVVLLSADPAGVSIADLVRLYRRDANDPELLQRAMGVGAIPEKWRMSLLDDSPGE
ncbi:MAG TPA: MOSC domain-containing protein [Bacteroidota bacterium]|nr:MOSC domain-containing protein [Bacteroidota bacterium]